MTREQEVLEIISKNPTIEQAEIADLLGITRSTVAVHIANLQKKGLLLGRGYIINEDNYVVGIGAANVDIYAKSDIEIRQHYDHPSKINTNVGGVTRNVCENLARLNGQVKLIAAVGDDLYGQLIIQKSKEAGIDCSNVLISKGQTSGIFMQVLDDNNDMHIALCDMSINSNLTREFIKSKEAVIKGASALILDSSLTIDVIEELLSFNKDIYLDTISDLYAEKIKPYVGKLYTLKCNKTEAEVLSDIKINDEKSLYIAADKILKTGLKKLYISLGRKGALYKDKDVTLIRGLKPIENPINASGCGDAFFAACIYGQTNELNPETILDYASAAGKATILSEYAINPEMSVELIENILKGEEK